jgi:hypothetical protein
MVAVPRVSTVPDMLVSAGAFTQTGAAGRGSVAVTTSHVVAVLLVPGMLVGVVVVFARHRWVHRDPPLVPTATVTVVDTITMRS